MAVIPIYTVAVLMSFLATRFGTTIIYGQSRGVYDHYFDDVPAADGSVVVLRRGAGDGGRRDGGPHLLRATPRPAARPASARRSAARCAPSITAGVFILLTITLSVYGQSGNFHLSG